MKIHRLTTVVLFSCLLLCFSSYSQINRTYITLGLGTLWTPDMGIFVHGFDHFSFGVFHTLDNERAPGPYFYDQSFPIAKIEQFKNHSEHTSYLLGITTNMQDIVDISLMVGPSIAQYTFYSNIQVGKNNYGYDYFSSYSREDYKKIGVDARVDISLTFSKVIGFNIALEANKNNQFDYFRFIVGLNFGLVRDLNRYK